MSWTADSTSATQTPIAGIEGKIYYLQENGYLVLRFLCDDVGKCLDEVLDAILRGICHQQIQRQRSSRSYGLPVLETPATR